jgi:kynureninase
MIDSYPYLDDNNIKEIDESVALVLLPGVQYSTGQFLNIPNVVKQARKHVCCVISLNNSFTLFHISHAHTNMHTFSLSLIVIVIGIGIFFSHYIES